MSILKRVVEKEQEGVDMIVTIAVGGIGTKVSARETARARAIVESGVNVPKALKERERITRIEIQDVDVSSNIPGVNNMGNVSGTITVRVRNAI